MKTKTKTKKDFPDFSRRHEELSEQKGLALLITLILSGVLLLISVAIIDITLKELVLSTSGRESQVAFYGANTGVECALYYDLNIENAFPPPGSINSPFEGLVCKGGEQSQDIEDCGNDDPCEYNFNFHVGDGSPCGQVTVTKSIDEDDFVKTEIESRGYNVCVEEGGEWVADTDSPRVLERALRVNY